MGTFALDRFEQQVDAFARARARRGWEHATGLRRDLGLATLYEYDFPSFTSFELYADLHEASIEDAQRKAFLQELLTAALLEGHTRDRAERAARFQTTATLPAEKEAVGWRAAPARWSAAADVSTRHRLEAGWRAQLGQGLNAQLQPWREELLGLLPRLGLARWSDTWATPEEVEATRSAAQALLDGSAQLYRHTLGVYFAQLDLPLDDAWQADADWAFRAPRLDGWFPHRSLMPVVSRTLRDLGVDFSAQPGLRVDLDARPGKAGGAHVVPLDVPREVGVSYQLVGGYQDYAALLFAVGQAQHCLHTDSTLPAAYRWLGDDATTVGYGRLLEALTREPRWLSTHLAVAPLHDYLVISHLAWLHRLRRTAAMALYEQRLWQPEAGGLAGDFVETMSAALALRCFPEPYLSPVRSGPWQPLRAATELRGEVFAAQVRAYLRREYDEEWFRHPRAGRFLAQELWRPGRRHGVRELLGYMGYAGLDASLLSKEIGEVLATV